MANDILLMDGVLYQEWTDLSHQALATMVKEHHKDIFVTESLYFEGGTRLRGGPIVAIPDGYCLTFNPDALWVIEVELSTADRGHLLRQLTDFRNGLNDPQTQRDLRDRLLNAWNQVAEPMDLAIVERATNRIGPPHPWLERLISSASIVVATEKATEEMRLTIRAIQPRIFEFRTFCRQGAEAVHIHQFEPLYQRVPPIQPVPLPRQGESLELTLTAGDIRHRIIRIPRDARSLFPAYGNNFEVEIDTETIVTHMSGAPRGTPRGDPDAGQRFDQGMSPWFRGHPELRAGSRLRMEVLQPGQRYRLSIEQA